MWFLSAFSAQLLALNVFCVKESLGFFHRPFLEFYALTTFLFLLFSVFSCYCYCCCCSTKNRLVHLIPIWCSIYTIHLFAFVVGDEHQFFPLQFSFISCYSQNSTSTSAWMCAKNVQIILNIKRMGSFPIKEIMNSIFCSYVGIPGYEHTLRAFQATSIGLFCMIL